MSNTVKLILKKVYYSQICRKLREYPEQKYFALKCTECKNAIYKISKRKTSQKTKLKIVFVLEYPEIWNSLKTVFEAFNESDIADAFILALPKYPDCSNNPAYAFASDIYKNVINGFEVKNSKWFDLKSFSPDYIFYSRPYDREYPNILKPKQTVHYAKLCYIPYGFEFVTGYHLEVEYNLKVFPYIYMVFCESRTTKEYCVSLIKGQESNKKIFDVGYPRFDLLYQMKQSSMKKSSNGVILWTPRWSLEGAVNDGTSYFKFIDPLLQYFSKKENKDLNLIIRPHPLMFDHFIKEGVMSKEDVQNLFQRISKLENIKIDSNKDYLLSAIQADLIISDFSSMLIEFLMLNIPVIYCGKSDSFDHIGKAMDAVMYHINSSDELIICLEQILYKGDILKEKREKIIAGLSGCFSGGAGKKIVDIVIKDYLEN